MSSCGTAAGYVEHRRRKQSPCEPCKKAWAAYYRDYRAGRKEKEQARVSTDQDS